MLTRMKVTPAANRAMIRVASRDISGTKRLKAQTVRTATPMQRIALIVWNAGTAPALKYPARISRFWVELALLSRRGISK